MSLFEKIDTSRVPKHVAIIMDGNGRWAQSQGQQRIYGHFNGVEAVRESLKAASKLGVKYLTLYAFSTENWNRPKEEVEGLMDLLVETIVNEIEELKENGVRFRAIGDINNLPGTCRAKLEQAVELTKENDKVHLILALSYSARWEMVQAVREIIKKGYESSEITAELISEHLETKDIPDPELLIRTSGEKRISNFLLWQIAYAELYFTETLWPDFDQEELYKAVYEYQHRERRFGQTSEQLMV